MKVQTHEIKEVTQFPVLKEVLFDDRLNIRDIRLFCIISVFIGLEGVCAESDERLAEILKVKAHEIILSIAILENFGYLERSESYILNIGKRFMNFTGVLQIKRDFFKLEEQDCFHYKYARK